MNGTLAQDPPAESKQENTCHSFGALAEHGARVAISMVLLMELFAWRPPTLRHARDASKAQRGRGLSFLSS